MIGVELLRQLLSHVDGDIFLSEIKFRLGLSGKYKPILLIIPLPLLQSVRRCMLGCHSRAVDDGRQELAASSCSQHLLPTAMGRRCIYASLVLVCYAHEWASTAPSCEVSWFAVWALKVNLVKVDLLIL